MTTPVVKGLSSCSAGCYAATAVTEVTVDDDDDDSQHTAADAATAVTRQSWLRRKSSTRSRRPFPLVEISHRPSGIQRMANGSQPNSRLRETRALSVNVQRFKRLYRFESKPVLYLPDARFFPDLSNGDRFFLPFSPSLEPDDAEDDFEASPSGPPPPNPHTTAKNPFETVPRRRVNGQDPIRNYAASTRHLGSNICCMCFLNNSHVFVFAPTF